MCMHTIHTCTWTHIHTSVHTHAVEKRKREKKGGEERRSYRERHSSLVVDVPCPGGWMSFILQTKVKKQPSWEQCTLWGSVRKDGTIVLLGNNNTIFQFLLICQSAIKPPPPPPASEETNPKRPKWKSRCKMPAPTLWAYSLQPPKEWKRVERKGAPIYGNHLYLMRKQPNGYSVPGTE